MILDQEKFNYLFQKKIEAYNTKVSAKFFELNDKESPCTLSERASILYQLQQRGIQFSLDEFSEEEKTEVKSFVQCLQVQMNKVLSQELKPVDLELSEIQQLLVISLEDVAGCCMTTDDVIKMINNG